MNYAEFLIRKSQSRQMAGFEPIDLPTWLLPFQRHLLDWSIRMGRSAILADCGMGKGPMALVWAENVAKKTGKPVLILTPLAVSHQFEREAVKFGIEAKRSGDGSVPSRITITNYERLQHFDATNFGGVVCDEASILKSFTGPTRKRITRFMSKMPYRLLATATAAPNDYVELGTLSEALGELSYSDMLRRFFQQCDDKKQKQEQRQQDEAAALIERDPNYFKKLAYRVAQTIGQWRLKHHAVGPFWRWVSSWAKACRLPSDLGFDDSGFRLPDLIERDHVITPAKPPPGRLFHVPAIGLRDERAERRRTIYERCEFVADLVTHNRPVVIWTQMNDEADELVKRIPDAEQIAGRTPDDRKVELYERFARGDLRVLVTKSKIAGFGLNWQHCADVVTFVTHSYEQHYQAVRRCYRFGQTRPVHVDVVATDGEVRVLTNMRRKAEKADAMFTALMRHMHAAERVERTNEYTQREEGPRWLAGSRQ